MFRLFPLCYHAATNGKNGISFLSLGFFSSSFFSAGVISVWVLACGCVCMVVVGGTVTVADRWPFLSDHVEHCLERSSEQKMDFISGRITGFKVQKGLCNLRALCIILHWLKWSFWSGGRVFFYWSEMEPKPQHRRGFSMLEAASMQVSWVSKWSEVVSQLSDRVHTWRDIVVSSVHWANIQPLYCGIECSHEAFAVCVVMT